MMFVRPEKAQAKPIKNKIKARQSNSKINIMQVVVIVIEVVLVVVLVSGSGDAQVRPNAVAENGALISPGSPQRPKRH